MELGARGTGCNDALHPSFIAFYAQALGKKRSSSWCSR
jgi:hypothetical protein